MTNAQMGLSCDHLNGERGVTQKIKQAMYDAAKQFVYIGFLLWEVRTYEYFYENNYSSVYEYAEAELGFKRSSTKNFIAICENFSKRDPNYKLPTMFLDERWSDYQYSQLTEMLAMSSKQREETRPYMTVKQLRQMKKKPVIEQVTMEELEACASGQTSGPKEEKQACTVNNYWADLEKGAVKELCTMSGQRYNPRSSYKIEISAIPKNKTRAEIMKQLCESCHMDYDPDNFTYGFKVTLKSE